MGTDIPTEPFVIDPLKNYLVTVHVWETPAVEACNSGIDAGTFDGGKTGAQIIAWLDAGFECTYTPLLFPPGLFIVERLINIEEV